MHPDPLNAPAPPEAVDAVCGARVSTADSPKLLFRGHRFYFCSSECRLAFKRTPDAHADARPEAAVAIPPLLPPRRRTASPFVILPDRATADLTERDGSTGSGGAESRPEPREARNPEGRERDGGVD